MTAEHYEDYEDYENLWGCLCCGAVLDPAEMDSHWPDGQEKCNGPSFAEKLHEMQNGEVSS